MTLKATYIVLCWLVIDQSRWDKGWDKGWDSLRDMSGTRGVWVSLKGSGGRGCSWDKYWDRDGTSRDRTTPP